MNSGYGSFESDNDEDNFCNEQRVKSVAIVGAGLAGTACAWVLKKRGIKSVIFEATDDIAGGASGNSTGIFSPRFAAEQSAEDDFYAYSYDLAINTFNELQKSFEIGYDRCGSLYLANTKRKFKRLKYVSENRGRTNQNFRWLEDNEASKVAGINLEYGGLYLADSGNVSPALLCNAYAHGTQVYLGVQLMMDDIEKYSGGWRIFGKSYDAVILACGEGAKWFKETSWLPVSTVRGQIIQVNDNGFADNLRCNVSYGGHISPDSGGNHTLGSTFQPWLNSTDVMEEDNEIIINNLKTSLSGASDAKFEAVYARAGLRTTSKDHYPIVYSDS